MPYLGNPPAERFTSLSKQTITGNGGTAYTLDFPVGSDQDVEVFVNNVRQEPGVAYTVSGTSLTMTGAVQSSDDFYVVFQGKAIGTISHPAANALQATSGTFTGNVDVGGTITASSITQNSGPAFFVVIGSNQSISASTITKLQFSSEVFDTDSCFDTSNYRFTPTVAGYYQINLNQEYSSQNGVRNVQILKNGARIASGGSIDTNAGFTFMSACSTLLYLNGSTDYVEAYGYTNQASTAFAGSSGQFSGALVRGA